MLTPHIIKQVESFARDTPEIEGLAVLGSHARGDAGPKADIDLVIYAHKKESEFIMEKAEALLSPLSRYAIKPDPKKWVFFLGDELLRLDLVSVQDPEEIKSLYLGSRIQHPEKAVLVDKNGTLLSTFMKWTEEQKRRTPNYSAVIREETEKFMDAFETASRYVNQNDLFRFYFNYNLALTRYARLVQLEKENDAFLYTPRRFLEDMDKDKQRSTERLAAPLKLSDAIPKMEHLIAEFLLTYQKLYSKYPDLSRSSKEIFDFTKKILNRDMVWNLRDIAWVAPDVLQEQRLYRSSALSRFESKREYDSLIKRLGIKRIIDLRLEHEVARYPYTDYTYGILDVLHLHMDTKVKDPFIFPKANAIHPDLLNNADIIRTFFELLAQQIPTLIHCHTGKDRTGVLVALAELAVGVSEEHAKKDFLASGVDITPFDADRFFGWIHELGGVRVILHRTGVPEEHILSVRQWLLKNN